MSTGWTIPFTPEVTAQGVEHVNRLAQARWLIRSDGGFVVNAIQGLPLDLLEEDVTRMLRHAVPELGQVIDAPSDHQIDTETSWQTIGGA